jgi:hypothetical protein
MRALVLFALSLTLALLVAACGRPTPTSARAAPVAERARYTFRRGVIVHHWLAMPFEHVRGKSGVPHTYAAPWFDAEDVDWIADHGFDHIVMAIDAALWLRADGSLDEAKLAPLEAALGWCRRRGLGLVAQIRAARVPVGQPDDLETSIADPRVRHARAERWQRIARRFAGAGDELRFLPGAVVLGEQGDRAAANELARAVLEIGRAHV